MADYFWGMNKGDSKTDVANDGVSTAKAIEVVLDLAANFTREDVLKSLDLIGDRIKQGVWPPA